MDLDVLYTLTSKIDNLALALMSQTALWNDIKQFSTDQYWWYLRVQNLMGAELRQRSGENWKAAYVHLERAMSKMGQNPNSNPFKSTYTNRLATSVLLELGFDPTLDHSAILSRVARESIEYGTRGEQLQVVKLLLEDGRSDPDPIIGNNYPLQAMIIEGDIEWVKRLLADDRVDLSGPYSINILIRACEQANTEIVRLLLEDGRIDPREKDWESNDPLTAAVGAGQLEVMKVLLADPRVDPNEPDGNPISEAAWNGRLEAMRILLADPRTDPNLIHEDALEELIENIDSSETAQLLFSDPRMNNED